jgi:uncharacterized protein
MTVICNATPLINFAAINHLDILKATFNQIIIPQAVFYETTGTDFPSANFVQQAIAASWLEVRTISPAGVNIAPELDAGEREAIALALETGIERILLDEREARQVAQQLGLKVIGTLGILLLAKSNQTVPQVRPLLDAMIDVAQYWVNDSLYQQVLQRAGEL